MWFKEFKGLYVSLEKKMFSLIKGMNFISGYFFFFVSILFEFLNMIGKVVLIYYAFGL